MSSNYLSEILDEGLFVLNSKFWIGSVLSRKIEDYTQVPVELLPSLFPSNYFSTNLALTDGLVYNLPSELMTKFVNHAMTPLIQQIDERICQQIIDILLAFRAISPSSVVGAQNCINWVQQKFMRNRTKAANRHPMFTEAGVREWIKSNVNLGDGAKTYQMPALGGYNLIFQQDAITLTSYKLPVTPSLGDRCVAQNSQHLDLRATASYNSPSQSTQIKLDCVLQVTRVNALHCCLIPEENFC